MGSISDTSNSVVGTTHSEINKNYASTTSNSSFKESKNKFPKTNDDSKPVIAWAGVVTIVLVLSTFWYRKYKKTNQQ